MKIDELIKELENFTFDNKVIEEVIEILEIYKKEHPEEN